MAQNQEVFSLFQARQSEELAHGGLSAMCQILLALPPEERQQYAHEFWRDVHQIWEFVNQFAKGEKMAKQGSRYLLNSAVITGPGIFEYYHISPPIAREWLSVAPAISRIGYTETAAYLEYLGAERPEVNRDKTFLEVGDEALVCRLVYRVTDPATKGQINPRQEDFELGILRKLK